jgi:hypothetical protein
VAANYNIVIRKFGQFMFMSLSLMVFPFFASNFKAGIFILTAFLIIFGVLVLNGVFKSAPKRNALGLVPSLSFCVVYSYYTLNGSVPDIPWAFILLVVWIFCAVFFTYLAVADEQQSTNTK